MECINNSDNYTNEESAHSGDLIFISDEGKKVTSINESTELNIINSAEDTSEIIPTQDLKINSNDFKDNLLASLYSQVEFLKNMIMEKDRQLEESNLHIRALLTKECDIYDIPVRRNLTSSIASIVDEQISTIGEISSVSDELSNSNSSFSDDQNTDEELFANLHDQFLHFQFTERERKREIEIKIGNQLADIRTKKHAEYITLKTTDGNKTDDNTNIPIDRGLKSTPEGIFVEAINAGDTKGSNEVKIWPNGTCLIMGSSLLNGVKQELMGPLYKVRAFPGAVIEDFYNYAIPLVKKKPSSIILMAGSNDAAIKSKSSQSILEDLLKLKSFLQAKFRCNVILSCPTYRFDDQKANVTLRNLRNNLLDLNIPVISNSNITDMHIGKKGLHLNERGSGRLAANYLSYMRKHH